MVSTRSRATNGAADHAGEKRTASSRSPDKRAKRAKAAKDGKLETNEHGEMTLQSKDEDKDGVEGKVAEERKEGHIETGDDAEQVKQTVQEPSDDSEAKEAQKPQGDDPTEKAEAEAAEEHVKEKEATPEAGDDEPKHGTLEAGHIYFMYRPKVEKEDVQSIDDISKFHILLIPQSPPHNKGHFHRIISVGKKKMPDPGAKHQVIWGLVVGVGGDKSALKDAFGASTYETKTQGTRHQVAARPAARGHYILHSPRDELADSPEHDRQRDFKTLLAYEITTPAADEFGEVQEELGLAPKDAVVLQVKDPNVESGGNFRAPQLSHDKRATYPASLQELFGGRRWIPANPTKFLSYEGTELLIISSPHKLNESLGQNGEKVEEDLDDDAKRERVGIDAAMKKLGMSEKDTNFEALEGEWA